MIAAAQYFKAASSTAVELTQEEKSFAEQMRVRLWNSDLHSAATELKASSFICAKKKEELSLYFIQKNWLN